MTIPAAGQWEKGGIGHVGQVEGPGSKVGIGGLGLWPWVLGLGSWVLGFGFRVLEFWDVLPDRGILRMSPRPGGTNE